MGKLVTICRVNVNKDDLRLFLYDNTNQPLKTFNALQKFQKDTTLVFAMNAGMYHRDHSPVGLLISEERRLAPLNTNTGSGNFFMKPNGVFLVSDKGAKIVETSKLASLSDRIKLATQSGPLLLQGGRMHPAFNSNSASRLIRNGVGVPSAEVAIFAISEEPVTFYEFAVLFRDVLHCPDALYLDGVISSLHAPKLRRSDNKAALGPIIAVVKP